MARQGLRIKCASCPLLANCNFEPLAWFFCRGKSDRQWPSVAILQVRIQQRLNLHWTSRSDHGPDSEPKTTMDRKRKKPPSLSALSLRFGVNVEPIIVKPARTTGELVSLDAECLLDNCLQGQV